MSLKNSNIISKIKRSKVTDYAALRNFDLHSHIWYILGSQKYPALDNLPATVDLPEDTLGGKELYVLNVTDENLDSVHIYSMTKVDPADASTMFSLDSRSKYDLRYSNLPNTVTSYFLM